MKVNREPLIADVIGILVGISGIVVAITSLGNNIEYLPDDPRSQPWFDPVVTSVMVVTGLLVLLVASVRLIQGLHSRK